jgi:SAM-dependent methyltransferase
VAVDQPVTRRLYDRLRPEDVAAVESALENGPLEAWEATPEPYRIPLVLCFGVWFHVPGVLERTGLVPAEPPPEVHAMARGPLAAGGDLYSADLVVDALVRAGRPIASVRRALDLGCSSGRTVRVLAAAYPETQWHAVDPNGPAIAWASRYVPGVSFSRSASEPPLPFPDGHFDLVFAISIWSHFSETAALQWLEEMHRVLELGGHLVLTVHGAQSVAYYAARGERPPEQADEIVEALQRRGFWFAQEFGEEGDHGVAHPGWGTAFMSAEWLLRHATPHWHVASYEVGRNADNQDVAVLRRC